MKDLGRKERSDMYPTSPESEKVRYPNLDLPLDVVDGLKLQIDDNVEIKLIGRVSGLQDTKWIKCVSFEVVEGEVLKKSKTK